MKKLAYTFDYKVKKETEGEEHKTIIEGFANRSFKKGEKVVDRGMEHIPPKEWDVKEWMKNPVILFNHDKDMPIGKGLAVDVKEDGLWIKCMISQSDAPEIKKVRDLIEEKILNSFSVGIDVQDEMEVDGAIHLKGVSLLETSVVAIPMNQESQFSISTKMVKEKSLSQLKQEVTKEKGAVLASEIHRRIGELQEENPEFSREEVLTQIAKIADIALDDLFEFLAGNMLEASIEMVDSFATNLGLSIDRLNQLNAVDMAINRATIERPEEPQDEIIEDQEAQEEMEGSETASQQAETEEEQNEAAAEETEEDIDNLEDELDSDGTMEAEEDEELEEDEEEKKKKSVINEKNFNECVSKEIREAMAAGKTQDQAIAYALNKCQNNKTTDPAVWNKIFDEIDEYKKSLPTMTEISPSGYVESSPGDAGLHEARQTNVLLGQLVLEIQGLKKVFAGAMMATPQAMTLTGSHLNANPDKKKDKNLDILTDYHRKLDERLKKLDV